MATQFAQSLVFDHVVSSTSQFIGRRRELSLVWNRFEAAKGGRARVVLLVGELGIGKTRLLEEVAGEPFARVGCSFRRRTLGCVSSPS